MTTIEARISAPTKKSASLARVKPADPKAGAKFRPTTTGNRVETRDEHTDRVTKHDRVLELLSQRNGASIEEMIQATEWQQHSVRGFLAGTVKKKMGLALTSSKAEGDVRRYRIATRRGR
jgi:Protein of unknown function (DUF3489)